jgi:aspartyl-tRNA(Asn)/glutamyl-tRNA(Gln) amidotransferase subunit A
MKTPTATDLVEQSLAAIAQHGERTNAFILVDADGARAAANAVDDERRRGIDRGPMHGMPISIKDLIDIAGQPTTAASKVRASHVATRDATVIRRLRDAGAVIIGKTNLHEFAFGTTSEETAYGAVHNPHDPTRSAGGSSGGSAAAVATGMGLASVGSDTGGSIRIPSSACGVVGLKPSLDEVPVDGVVPLCKTFDHVGPITRSVKDAGILWSVLADRPLPNFEAPAPNALKLGALGGYFTALLEHDVRVALTAALEQLRAAGVTIDERTVAGTDTIIDAYVDISLPEASHWHAATLDARPGDYQTPVRERLERGRTISAVRYLKARGVRDILRAAVDTALHAPSACDALVLPTLPIVPPVLGAAEAAMDAPGAPPLAVRAAMLRLTQLFNMTGHPAISLPIRTRGLPVGLQLVGRLDRTEDLLAVATTCERILSN